MMRLISIALDRGKVADWDAYPFTVPAIRAFERIDIRSRIVFFVGENGSGKSTLLEAIAGHYGFGPEGGNRNTQFASTDTLASIDPLRKALRLAFSKRTGKGFYLRAESFFNLATYVDNLGVAWAYGGISLHHQSHGESFFAILENRIESSGLYMMDEPEAALSPQRQLAMLAMLHQIAHDNNEIQFIIATHSPILLSYPDAQILSFDEGKIREISYRETQSFRIMSGFMASPERYLHHLLQEEQKSLFNDKES
jgi:predicted ATPase